MRLCQLHNAHCYNVAGIEMTDAIPPLLEVTKLYQEENVLLTGLLVRLCQVKCSSPMVAGTGTTKLSA